MKSNGIILTALLPAFLLMVPVVTAEQPTYGTATFTYTQLKGSGEEEGVSRRDPSDVIQVGELYYVWYSRGPVKTGYNATVWYATSPDGVNWTEKGEAVGKGKAGAWDESNTVVKGPWAGGTYRPEAFTGSSKGEAPTWGVEIGRGGKLFCIQRFDIEWSE